jgi:hypothetical protein
MEISKARSPDAYPRSASGTFTNCVHWISVLVKLHHFPKDWASTMTELIVEFWASSNGDRWFLVQNEQSMVTHQANAPSGGARKNVPVSDFLQNDHGSPQHYALLRLLTPEHMDAETATEEATGKLAEADESHNELKKQTIAYENGMQIIWDVVTREIIVIFRGAVTAAPIRFENRGDGIAWGENLCREAGWGEPERKE